MDTDNDSKKLDYLEKKFDKKRSKNVKEINAYEILGLNKVYIFFSILIHILRPIFFILFFFVILTFNYLAFDYSKDGNGFTITSFFILELFFLYQLAKTLKIKTFPQIVDKFFKSLSNK